MKKSNETAESFWLEEKLQQECFLWYWNERPETRRLIFAVPNGEKRSKVTANKLKGTGVISGVSDLVFIWKGKVYLFELKVGSNTLSPNQKLFRDITTEHGAVFYEIRSVEQFKVIFDQIIQRNA